MSSCFISTAFHSANHCLEQALSSNERSPFEISSSMYVKSMTRIWISPRPLATYSNPGHPNLTSIPLPLYSNSHTEVSQRFRHTSLDDTAMTANLCMFHQRDGFLSLPSLPTSRSPCQLDELRLVTLSLLSLRVSHALIAVDEKRCSQAHAWPLFHHRLNKLECWLDRKDPEAIPSQATGTTSLVQRLSPSEPPVIPRSK